MTTYQTQMNVLQEIHAAKGPKEYLRQLKRIAQEVNELVDLSGAHLKALGAVQMIVVNDDGGKRTISPQSSPEGTGADKPTYLKIPNIRKLTRNYEVTLALHEKSRDIDLIEAELQLKFGGKGNELGTDPATHKALAQIQLIREKVRAALITAATFLNKVASQHAPKSFIDLTKTLGRIIARGIEYAKIQTYLYVYPDKDGGFIFLQYYRLFNVVDADGSLYPEYYICLSCKPTADGKFNYRMTTMHNFEAPGRFPLGKEVSYTKQSDSKVLKKILSFLLDMDSLANNFAKIPIQTLLRPGGKISRKSFTVEESVKDIEIDEGVMRFTFVVDVNTLTKAQDLATQLNVELQVMAQNTRAKLRQKVGADSKGVYSATFFFTRPAGFPVSSPDLAFLKDRFNIDDDTVGAIVDNINKN